MQFPVKTAYFFGFDGALRAAAVRSIDEIITESFKERRYAAIAELLNYWGIGADRHLVRPTLCGGKT